MGDGIVYNGDSLRDWLGGLSILGGQLPERGPACGKLGFYLGLLYYHLVAAILSVDRSTEWIAVFLCGWRALEPILFFHLVRRLAVQRIALTAAALYVGSDAIRSIGHLFTHSAFMMPFELVGLLALDAHLRGRRFALAVMLGALSAALQFHASAVSVFAFAVLTAIACGRDRPWFEVLVAWLAFLAPALPLYGEAAFHAAVMQRGVAAALLSWLTSNNALLPSLLGVAVMARPSLLRSRHGLAKLLALTAVWALWFASRRDPGETSLVLRLFNFELRPPVLDESPVPIEPGHAIWIWSFFQIFESTPGLAAWMYGTAAAAGTFLAARSAFATSGSSGLDRRGARFVLAWLAAIAAPALYANLRAPTVQPQYVVHLAPPLIVLMACGVTAIADRLAAAGRRWWSERPGRRRRAAVIAALAMAVTVDASMVVPAVLLASQLPLAPLPLAAAIVPTALWLRGFGIVGAEHASLSFDRATAALARYASDDLGLGWDVRRRVHGTTESDTWWGDIESAWTLWMLTHDSRPPDPAKDPTLHYRLRGAAEAGRDPRILPVPQTSLALDPYRAALRADQARISAPPTDDPTAFPLPYRMNFVNMPEALADALALVPIEALDPDRARLRIVVPRDPPHPETGDAIRILLHEGASPATERPCQVGATLDGQPLPPAAESRGRLRDTVFRLPHHPLRAVIELTLDGCYPDFIDVFDER